MSIVVGKSAADGALLLIFSSSGPLACSSSPVFLGLLIQLCLLHGLLAHPAWLSQQG